MSAAVAIVVVGVVILNHETGTLINPANNNIGTTSPGSSLSGSGTTANSKRWKLPLGVTPAPTTGTGQRNYVPSAPALPAVACTPTPKPAVTTSAPSGGRHGDADPDPERVRDRHAHPDPERVRVRHAHPDQPGHQRHGYRAGRHGPAVRRR